MRPLRGRSGQEGQSLAEFVLAIPVLVLAALAALQAASLGLASLFVRYAVQCAARSYAVYYPLENEKALGIAEAAATQALRLCRPRPAFDLRVLAGHGGDQGILSTQSPSFISGQGPAFFYIHLDARVPLFLRVPGLPRSWPMHAMTSTYSERTREFERGDP